jgi:hypothetical protein
MSSAQKTDRWKNANPVKEKLDSDRPGFHSPWKLDRPMVNSDHRKMDDRSMIGTLP